MTSILFRELTPQDEPFLWEMMYQAIFVPAGSEPPARDVVNHPELRKYTAEFGRPGDMGYVAVDCERGEPIGAAWLRLFTASQPGYGYVDDATPELTIALAPAYRGQGIGSALLAHLLAAAQARYRAVSLSVWPDNPVYRLYQRLGFRVVKRNEHDVIMVKHLGRMQPDT